MPLSETPVKANNFFSHENPHNPGGDDWLGTLTPTLQFYKPAVGEQGWGLIVDYNFAILDDAMLRGWDQVITGVNEFRNRVQVRVPQERDEAANRDYTEREVRLMTIIGLS